MKNNNRNKKAVEIYDEIAEEYARNFDGFASEYDLLFLDAFLSHVPPKSHIIDLGCGTGFSAGYFAKKGMSVEGADLSKGMIAVAIRNYPKIRFSIADMREYRPEKTADAVWAGYSIFHFSQADFEKTLARIKTYLKPGGIFGLVVQEGDGEVEQPELLVPDRKIYIHLYTENQLGSILKNAGFEVVEQARKKPVHGKEFPFDKLLVVARLKMY